MFHSHRYTRRSFNAFTQNPNTNKDIKKERTKDLRQENVSLIYFYLRLTSAADFSQFTITIKRPSRHNFLTLL